MQKQNKPDAITSAINRAKTSKFGLTAIKVEFEAHLKRRNTGGTCDFCEEGWVDCEFCDSDGQTGCPADCDSGSVSCSRCDGNGQVPDLSNTIDIDCLNCDAEGWVSCPEDCDEGYVSCGEESEHEEGYIRCGECHGNWEGGDSNWHESTACHNYLMEKLADLGLAEFKREDYIQLSHGIQTQWHPILPLTYAEFYDDGSVDSELTLTLMLDDPENINLLPKLQQIWNEFGQMVENDGGQVDLSNAGMHMALLSDSRGRYPADTNMAQRTRFGNFRRSMTLLIPALFFLGSPDSQSRELRFRLPQISRDQKYSAIYYRGGALEFRVFNPCYDSPEVILDNAVVMCNAINRYWKDIYIPSGLEKITRATRFGNDNNGELDRFYVTVEHVDLLNQGLEKLKPCYLTIKEIKAQRGFKTNKRTVMGAVKIRQKQAELEFNEYEERFKYENIVARHKLMAQAIERRSLRTPAGIRLSETEILAQAEAETEAYIKQNEQSKQSLKQYVDQAISQFMDQRRGHYELRA